MRAIIHSCLFCRCALIGIIPVLISFVVGGSGLSGSEGYNSFISIAYPIWPIAMKFDGAGVINGILVMLLLNSIVFIVFCAFNKRLSILFNNSFISIIVSLFIFISIIYFLLGDEFSIVSGFIGILFACVFYIVASLFNVSNG